MSLIKKDATYSIKDNKISLSGTDVNQAGDILADIMLLIPKKIELNYGKKVYVSKGAYLQAIEIYSKIVNGEYDKNRTLYISGHSLGAGVGQVLALMINEWYFCKDIYLDLKGSIKVLSRGARKALNKSNIHVTYNRRHRDPVPMLGWWKEPVHKTARTGDKKKHIFDYDMKEHVMYWGQNE